jgi:hypothetical protein
MAAKRNHIKVFVASTVHNFETVLKDIRALLDGFGYEVSMSHSGTIFVDSFQSNLQNCIDGVRDCDVFVGLIRPDYGSGVLDRGGKSITHQEFETAYELNKPRFVLVDYRVTFTRSLFRSSYFIENMTEKRIDFDHISFDKNSVMDTRCIRMYNDAIKDKEKPANRIGNWVQEYITPENIMMYLESQFKYPERIQKLIDKSNNQGL